MAEDLCGNFPDAMTTPHGLYPEKPCGLFYNLGIGWCSYADFKDWMSTYKIRIDMATNQAKYLSSIRNKGEYVDKDVWVSDNEWKKKINIDNEITDINNNIKMAVEDFKNLELTTIKDGESDYYKTLISDIITKANDINCLIERIQDDIEVGYGLRYQPTGIIKGSRTEYGPVFYFFLATFVVGAVVILRKS